MRQLTLRRKRLSTFLQKRRKTCVQSRKAKSPKSIRTGFKNRCQTESKQEGNPPILSSLTRRPFTLVKPTRKCPERLSILFRLLRPLRRAGSRPTRQPFQAKEMGRTGILKTLMGRIPSTRNGGTTSRGANHMCITLLNKTIGNGIATGPSHMAIIRPALTLHRFTCPESHLETIIKGRNNLPASTPGTSTARNSRRGWRRNTASNG
jgi:hypothetical protein